MKLATRKCPLTGASLDDLFGGAHDYDADDNDATIPGIVDTRFEALVTLPDWPSYFEKWKAENTWGGDQGAIQGAIRDFQGSKIRHNQALRSARRRAEKCRARIVATFPRHAAILFSDEFEADDPAIVAMAKCLADSKRTIVVLAGRTGNGKTMAALYAANEIAAGDPDELPAFTSATELARSSRYEREDRDRILKASSLIIDDLGAEFPDSKGSFRVDVDELVDAFYSTERRLIITTNLSFAEFEERYGQRVVDRLAEAGTWIPVTGASRRRK